jgi:DNA-binding response OmpR family regulator
MKKILLMEPDREQTELLTTWFRGESYKVSDVDNPQKAHALLDKERFDLILMDCDEPEITESALKLVPALKADSRYKDLSVAVLTYKKETEIIISALEAGVDFFAYKPFETDSFLMCIKKMLRVIELKSKGKKALDLNYVNYLIDLAGQMERKSFFAFSHIIINKLIIEKINTILGGPIIAKIIERLNESIGGDHEFMKLVDFIDNSLSFSNVDKASKEVPVNRISIAFRDYLYAFLQFVGMLTSDILMER